MEKQNDQIEPGPFGDGAGDEVPIFIQHPIPVSLKKFEILTYCKF